MHLGTCLLGYQDVQVPGCHVIATLQSDPRLTWWFHTCYNRLGRVWLIHAYLIDATLLNSVLSNMMQTWKILTPAALHIMKLLPCGNYTFPNWVHHQNLESTWPAASQALMIRVRTYPFWASVQRTERLIGLSVLLENFLSRQIVTQKSTLRYKHFQIP